jgi:cytidylate kinase
MSVVTISRGSFSGGKLLAENLAENLQYRCVDRDVIVERATAACSASPNELKKALDKPPTFLDRLKHKRYIYLAVIQAALAEEVQDGRVVYHGHAGHFLLKGGGPVFCVRIIAPTEFRIAMAQKRLGLGRREVVSYIEKVDEERKKWAQYLYGVDWTDASLYDMVVNLVHVDLDFACETVANAIRRQKCFQLDDECRAAMHDLAVASRIRANLALNAPTSALELEVAAKDGRVRLTGKIATVDQIDEIYRVARQVEGVTEINVDELVSPVVA